MLFVSALAAPVALLVLLLGMVSTWPAYAQSSDSSVLIEPQESGASLWRDGTAAQGDLQAPPEFVALADTQRLLGYTIRYRDDFNGNPGGIFLTVNGDGTVELNTYSTPYHPLQGYTGFYTWQIGQDLLAELIRLMNSKEFVEEPSQVTTKPDEAYQRLALYKDNQELYDRFYTSETSPPPLTAEIMRRLHEVPRHAMASRPVRGLSVEMNALPDIRSGEPILISYTIQNTGTEAISIDNFTSPALITLFISGEGDKDSIYVELDHTKFISSRRPDTAGRLLIPEGDRVVLGYKITANNLQKGSYYVAAGSQLQLSYSGSAKVTSEILIYAKPQTFHILN